MVPFVLIKEPGCQTRSRPQKLGITCKHPNSYMAKPEKKQIDTYPKMERQMYFSGDLPGVNPVVTNYKIRHNKNWPVRYSLAWLDCFPLLLVVAEKLKTWSGRARLHARVAMEESLLIM